MGFRKHIGISDNSKYYSFISELQSLIVSNKLCDIYLLHDDSEDSVILTKIIDKYSRKVLIKIYKYKLLDYYSLYFRNVERFTKLKPDMVFDSVESIADFLNSYE